MLPLARPVQQPQAAEKTPTISAWDARLGRGSRTNTGRTPVGTRQPSHDLIERHGQKCCSYRRIVVSVVKIAYGEREPRQDLRVASVRGLTRDTDKGAAPPPDHLRYCTSNRTPTPHRTERKRVSLMIPIPTNPECRDGKHRNCQGDAWDESKDAPALCECPCHFTTQENAA